MISENPSSSSREPRSFCRRSCTVLMLLELGRSARARMVRWLTLRCKSAESPGHHRRGISMDRTDCDVECLPSASLSGCLGANPRLGRICLAVSRNHDSRLTTWGLLTLRYISRMECASPQFLQDWTSSTSGGGRPMITVFSASIL